MASALSFELWAGRSWGYGRYSECLCESDCTSRGVFRLSIQVEVLNLTPRWVTQVPSRRCRCTAEGAGMPFARQQRRVLRQGLLTVTLRLACDGGYAVCVEAEAQHPQHW